MSSQKQPVDIPMEAGDELPPESRVLLGEFYEHLGSMFLVGSPGHDETLAERWQRDLAAAGWTSIAGAWENLWLISQSREAFFEGLTHLALATGAALRSCSDGAGRSTAIAVHGGTEETGCGPGDVAVLQESDPAKLGLILRVGSLRQKRFAANALGDFLARGRKLAPEHVYASAFDSLTTNRDPAITFEVNVNLARLSGAEARRARSTLERMDGMFESFSQGVRRYWDGEAQRDPLDALEEIDLVALGMWLRRTPDPVAGHVSEYLVEGLGARDDRKLASVTGALVLSGDDRLLPVLVRVLQDGGSQSRLAAIKAIAHVDDPRSVAALVKALRHSGDTLERIALARALATCGDSSGTSIILDGMAASQGSFVREEAFKALADLPEVPQGTLEGAEELLSGQSPALSLAALRAMARHGDAATLEVLASVAAQNPSLKASALRAAEDLRARLVLEGAPGCEMALLAGSTMEGGGLPRPGLLRRSASVWWFTLGILAVGFRRLAAARRYATRASAANKSSAKGQFLEAYAWVREGRHDMAIECYRKGLQVDPQYAVRRWGEADRVLWCYIRLAEKLEESSGGKAEALELLEETEFVDLRGADPNLKIEVERRREHLQMERRLLDRPREAR